MGWTQDLRFAGRTLRKNPGLSAVAVLALALGIGANTLIFSVVNGTLLRPLALPDSASLVIVYELSQAEGQASRLRPAAADFLDFRNGSRTIESMAGVFNMGLSITSAAEPKNPLMQRVTSNYFSVLGVEPSLGRAFLPEEDRYGGPKVTVLSYGLWQDLFGGDPGVIGKTVDLAYEPYEVVGVMPAAAENPFFQVQPALYLPLALSPEERLDRRMLRQGRRAAPLFVFGRLADGVSLPQAQEEMDRILAALAEEHPAALAGRGIEVVRLKDRLVESYRRALMVLFGAVAFVLLIACANVANLLLARALGRRKEIAVRLALGAGRLHLVRQLLIESLVLGALGGGLGLGLAAWGLDPLSRLVPANGLFVPDLSDLRLDGRVVAFTLGLSLLTSLAFGLLPARQVLSGSFDALLSAGAVRSTLGRRSIRLRQLLVVTEVALSVVLLVGAGLMIRTFSELRHLPGIDPTHVISARTGARGPGFDDPAGAVRFHRLVLASLRALPGVESAGSTDVLPMLFGWLGAPVTIAGRPAEPGDEPLAMALTVTPGFFETVRLPLVRGRLFTDEDADEAPGVVLINRTMAERYWRHGLEGGSDPLGEEVTLDGFGGQVTARIVGIVGDHRNPGTQNPEPQPLIYLAHAQNPRPNLSFVLRSSRPAADLMPDVRSAIWKISRDVPVYGDITMTEVVARTTWQARFVLVLLGFFAGLALVLATTGIYAVLSYLVSQRTREIGIRVAVGARARDIVAQVLRSTTGLAVAGIGTGLVVALIAARALESQIFGVTPSDPWTYAGISLFLGLVVLGAGGLPAWRASRVDPIVALREE